MRRADALLHRPKLACPTQKISGPVGRKEHSMARTTQRPVVTLRSTAGTGVTYVTRKNRQNDPDRLVLRKYDPVVAAHVEFREVR